MKMISRRTRNFLGETAKEEKERRLNALEAHIQDLEQRFTRLDFTVKRHVSMSPGAAHSMVIIDEPEPDHD